MVHKNEYEKLRMPGEPGGVPSDIANDTIYSSSAESVMLVTAEMRPGVWAYGYVIYFENGRRAERRPGDSAGWFKSREDATLYFLGYIMQYREYFTDTCIYAVKKRILSSIEQSLFQ